VTGASRGVGRGVATALTDAGFTVHGTGRTIAGADLPTAVIRHRCDHLNDAETAAVFATITATGGIDLLVNAAWGGYEGMIENGVFTWTRPFWEQPIYRWTGMIDAGVRAAFVCSALAARVMVPNRQGLIVNISFWPAQKYVGNTIYGIAKAATDKLTFDTAHELRAHDVAVVSLYPGLVRTEAVMAAASWLDLSNSESPEFSGRAVAALAADPGLLRWTGRAVIAAELALAYRFTDVDGKQPRPLTLADV
jgi:NAD(P)-dependent dehydrogenase (short-subunit alcohol dehydrogenase family)